MFIVTINNHIALHDVFAGSSLGSYSISHKMSYHKILQRLEGARSDDKMLISLWNFAGAWAAAQVPNHEEASGFIVFPTEHHRFEEKINNYVIISDHTVVSPDFTFMSMVSFCINPVQ